MTPKRILYIHHGTTHGGAFLSLMDLLRSLDRTRYAPIVCNGGDEQDPQVDALFSTEGFAVCSCRLPRFMHTTGGGYSFFHTEFLLSILHWFKYYPIARIELQKLLNTVKPDLVHFNSLTYAPYACVAKNFNIPALVHVRESVLGGSFGIRRAWLRRHLMKNTSKVIAICHDNLNCLDLPAGKGTVIYNPISLKKFDFRINKDVARQRLGVPLDAKVVLMTVTSIPQIKGYGPFITAMRRVALTTGELWCLIPGLTIPAEPHPEINSARMALALAFGRYRDQEHLYALANEDGLRGRVIYCDYTRDMEQWIAAADVVCVPHTSPHFSRTLLEAGAMKKPVVASRIGGVEECVREGETGLLVPPGDVQTLACAVEQLLQDGPGRELMGEKNYQFVISEANAALSAQRVMEVYHELLD